MQGYYTSHPETERNKRTGSECLTFVTYHLKNVPFLINGGGELPLRATVKLPRSKDLPVHDKECKKKKNLRFFTVCGITFR